MPGKTAYECAIRNWSKADLMAAADISHDTAWKALNDQRVAFSTAVKLALAFNRTKDQILPEVVEFLGGDPSPEAA